MMPRKKLTSKNDRTMPMVHPNAAAIDVGSTLLMAAVRADCNSKFEGPSRRLIQKGAGFVEGVADSGKTPIETDKIEKIAMFTRRRIYKFPCGCIG